MSLIRRTTHTDYVVCRFHAGRAAVRPYAIEQTTFDMFASCNNPEVMTRRYVITGELPVMMSSINDANFFAISEGELVYKNFAKQSIRQHHSYRLPLSYLRDIQRDALAERAYNGGGDVAVISQFQLLHKKSRKKKK